MGDLYILTTEILFGMNFLILPGFVVMGSRALTLNRTGQA